MSRLAMLCPYTPVRHCPFFVCHWRFLHFQSPRFIHLRGVRRMNEVNARRARLVPGWVTVFVRVYHLGM